jgi:hypothetical protein
MASCPPSPLSVRYFSAHLEFIFMKGRQLSDSSQAAYQNQARPTFLYADAAVARIQTASRNQ